MAQEIVGIKIQVGGQEKILSSMGEIRKEMKAAQFEVLKMSEAFGSSSKEAIEAAKRVAHLKDAIGDAKDLVGAFNPDAKFKALSGSIQGVAGGFAALQGALGLVGVEGENVQKTLLKVQSALALSEGLNSVMGSIDAFKNLGAVIKNTVVSAFSSLKSAIISTGVGALVIGLGLLIANFEKVKQVLTNLIPGFGKLADFVGNLITSITDFVGATSAAERALDALNKTTARSNEGIEARIKVLSAQGGKEQEIFELSKKRNENELTFLRATLKEKGKLSDEELKKFRELKTDQQVLDAKEQKRVSDDLKEKNKKAADAAKEANEKNKKFLQERADAEKEAAERITKLNGEIAVLGIKNEYDAKRKEIDNQLVTDIDQVNKNEKIKADTKAALIKALNQKASADNRKVIDEEIEADKKVNDERDKKFAENQRSLRQLELQSKLDDIDAEIAKKDQDFQADQDRFEEKMSILEEQKTLELQAAENDELKRNEIIKKYSDERKEIVNAEAENEQKAHDAKVALQVQLLDTASTVLGGMSTLFEQGSTASKVFALSDIAIGTAKGYIQGLDIAQKGASAAGPAAPFAFPIFYATQIAAVLGAVAKAKSVLTTAKGSGGGGGGSTPAPNAIAPVMPAMPQATLTKLDSQSIDQMGNAANRSYVIESDVSNSQERIKRINRAARLT